MAGSVAVGVWVNVGVCDGEGVSVAVASVAGVKLAVGVWVLLGVMVGVFVGTGVGVLVGSHVDVGVAVLVGNTVGVAVGVLVAAPTALRLTRVDTQLSDQRNGCDVVAAKPSMKKLTVSPARIPGVVTPLMLSSP